jgi:tetrahydromethanopterin S-methyltransferase subunit B
MIDPDIQYVIDLATAHRRSDFDEHDLEKRERGIEKIQTLAEDMDIDKALSVTKHGSAGLRPPSGDPLGCAMGVALGLAIMVALVALTLIIWGLAQ